MLPKKHQQNQTTTKKPQEIIMRYIKSSIACKIHVVIFSLYLLLVGLRAETLGPDSIGESDENDKRSRKHDLWENIEKIGIV